MDQRHRGFAPVAGATRRTLAMGLRRWATLPVVLTGTFVVILDFFIVNVAIPSMQEDLHAGAGLIQFVVAGYALAFAAGLITGGRLGDLYGRRRLFGIGLAVFTLASAACGLAPNGEWLVLARVVQGIGASLLAPQVLAILGIAYTGRDRPRAFAAYGVAMGLGSITGQLIGGLLIHADAAGLGWRACFLINVPLCAVTLAVVPWLVPESRSDRPSRLDPIGVVLVTFGLAALLLPLVEGRELGWPLWTRVCLAASLAVLVAFGAHQRRELARGHPPLVDLTLFRDRAFAVSVLAVLVFYTSVASFFLVLALYLQRGERLSPLGSGAVFTAMAFGFCVTSMCAPSIGRRLGRQSIAFGALIMVAALTWLRESVALIGASGHPALLVPALLLNGAGMGMVMAPMSSTALAGIAPRHAGAAAGVLAATQQLANALGVAIIGFIFYGALGGVPRVAGYPGAFRASLIYCIAAAAVVAAVVQFLPRAAAPRAAGSARDRAAA